jgi:hypothetical protein
VENILPAPDKPLPQPAPDRQVAAVSPPAATDSAETDNDANSQVAEDAAVGQPVRLVPEPPQPKPIQARPVNSIARLPVAKPLPKPKPVALHEEAKPRPAETRVKETGGSGYRLQLASLRSDGDARAVEGRLRRSYGDLLGAVGFSVVQVNLGERGTYYRVMAGPMGQGTASQLCDSLRQRGAACILAKP